MVHISGIQQRHVLYNVYTEIRNERFFSWTTPTNSLGVVVNKAGYDGEILL